MRMTRRAFVKLTGLGTGGLYFSRKVEAQAKNTAPKLEAFIVSDAHLGWDGKDQPSVQEQKEAMSTILNRFPDLDLFIDTGDAHHGNAQKQDWGHWLDVIAGGCPRLPFYYTSGNHEMKWGLHNAEKHIGKLGSLSCRPYYSYDLKGIHFVSVPQLIRVNYVTEETLDWLRLDLEVHRDKTTILLSHNELRGTTEYFDSIAYRQVANSNQLFQLIEQNPQVVAWCHGHNHTYEIVKKGNVLYVSNGRIGGFSPPTHWVKEYGNKSFGRDHLGGIYILVTRDAVTIRGFSATANKFLSELTEEELGPAGGTVDHLSQKRKVETSLEPSQPVSHCFGVGRALHGLPFETFRHHLLDEKKGSRTLYLTKPKDEDLIENGDFTSYTVKSGQFGPWIPAWGVEGPHSPGSTTGPKGEESNEDPGLFLSPSQEGHRLETPHGASRHSGYYPASADASYRVKLKAQSEETLPPVRFEVEGFLDQGEARQNPKIFHEQSSELSFDPSASTLEWAFSVPPWNHLTNESLPSPATPILLSILILIPSHEKELRIDNIEFCLVQDDTSPEKAALWENGTPLHERVQLRNEDPVRLPLPVRQENISSSFEVRTEGSSKVTWLIQEQGILLQARNAPVARQGNQLTVGPLRSDYSPREEVLLVPFPAGEDFHVHSLRHIQGARIEREGKEASPCLRIEVQQLSKEEGEIELWGPPPKKVQGAEVAESTSDRTVLKVREPGWVEAAYI